MLAGNPRDPHDNTSDYTEIVRECYKGYINHLYQEMAESVVKDGNVKNAIDLFKKKLMIVRQVNGQILQSLHEEDNKK